MVLLQVTQMYVVHLHCGALCSATTNMYRPLVQSKHVRKIWVLCNSRTVFIISVCQTGISNTVLEFHNTHVLTEHNMHMQHLPTLH